MTRTLAKTIALAAVLTLCLGGAALADFDDDWCGSVPRWPIPPGPYHYSAAAARINPALAAGLARIRVEPDPEPWHAVAGFEPSPFRSWQRRAGVDPEPFRALRLRAGVDPTPYRGRR